MTTNKAMRDVACMLCLCVSTVVYGSESRPRIELDGVWQFRMDPQGAGEVEAWHSAGVTFSDTIRVPGCWQAQGFGTPSGILRNHYAGSAWYRRTVAVPAGWNGKSILLTVGGAALNKLLAH